MKFNSGSKRSPNSQRTTGVSHKSNRSSRSRSATKGNKRSASSRQSSTKLRSRRTRSSTTTAARRVDRSPTSVRSRVLSLSNKLQPMILPNDLPGWLQSLMQVQRVVWVSTVVLSTGALGAYGWSVYSQQEWGRAYSQLQQLQRNERQLISGNELMKNQIAQHVDPKALGLTPKKPNNVIFIQPNPSSAKPPASPAPPVQSPPSVKQPLGY